MVLIVRSEVCKEQMKEICLLTNNQKNRIKTHSETFFPFLIVRDSTKIVEQIESVYGVRLLGLLHFLKLCTLILQVSVSLCIK